MKVAGGGGVGGGGGGWLDLRFSADTERIRIQERVQKRAKELIRDISVLKVKKVIISHYLISTTYFSSLIFGKIKLLNDYTFSSAFKMAFYISLFNRCFEFVKPLLC